MADVVLAVGVHSNEIHCRQFEEPLKKRLEALGHDVRIVRYGGDCRAQAEEFNRGMNCLRFLDHMNASGSQAMPPGFSSDEAAFLSGLLKASFRAFDEGGLMYQTTLKEELGKAGKEGFVRVNFRTASKWLLGQFRGRGLLLEKVLNAPSEYSRLGVEATEREVEEEYMQRPGTIAFCRRLSEEHPRAHIFQLHNSGADEAPQIKQYCFPHDARREFGGGTHTVGGPYAYSDVEMVVMMSRMPRDDPLYLRFHKQDGSLRNISRYEERRGTHMFERTPENRAILAEKDLEGTVRLIDGEIADRNAKAQAAAPRRRLRN
jgi:hypothetical protein